MGPLYDAMKTVGQAIREGNLPEKKVDHTETLRTILSLLDSNASRDNIRRVIEAEIGGE